MGEVRLCLMKVDRYGYDHVVWMLERKRERGWGCKSEKERGGGGVRQEGNKASEPDCYHETGRRTLMSNVHLCTSPGCVSVSSYIQHLQIRSVYLNYTVLLNFYFLFNSNTKLYIH